MLFDDRDFVLADQNETRKIWAEKYLDMELNTAEAEHFALYRSCVSALTGKLTNEARTPCVVPGPLDPAVESSNTLRPYASALDRGETLVGLRLKSGPFVTTVPAVEKRNGRCVLHLLTMSPLPVSATQSSKMFLPWFSASLFDQLFRGLQEPVSALVFHAPTLSGSGFALVGEVAVTEGSKRLASDKAQDVVLACFKTIATSPFTPPSHGNVFPPLDYAGLNSRRIIQAAAMQSAVAERWGNFSKIFSSQSEDLAKLDRHQFARANGLECLRVPYEPEFSKIVAFACASVPLHSCLNQKEGKIAPPIGTTPVLEKFIWEDGEGGFQSRSLTLFDAANDQGRLFNLKTELEYLGQSGYSVVAAGSASQCGSMLGIPMAPARTVISNAHYHHPAALLEPEDCCRLIRLLGRDRRHGPRPPVPLPLTSLVEIAKGLLACKGANLKGGLKSRFQALEDRLDADCYAVFALRNLAQERCKAITQLSPELTYSLEESITWAAYRPEAVDQVLRPDKKKPVPGINREVFPQVRGFSI